MKYPISVISLVIVFLVYQSASAQKLLSQEEDWLGSREGLLVGKETKKFLSSVGIENKITRAMIRLKRRPKGAEFVFSDEYRIYETWREVEIKEESALFLAEIGLRRSKWKPPTSGIGAGGGVPFGEIVFESEQGSIRVFLDGMFLLDDGPGCYDSKHQFESWTLAKLVDEALREKYGEGLSHFETASGERGIQSEQDSFEKLWKSKSKE